MVVEIDKTLLSLDLFEKQFVCNLDLCKGACCVQGDAGAPLAEDELPILKAIYPKVKPYLRPEGIRAIERQGPHVREQAETDEATTPLVEGKECAYVVFSKDGKALCGIELAWRDKKIGFQKPISCHLYPIRVSELSEYDALNYDQWDICKPALKCGRKAGVPLYRFTKDALVRKYGAEWYAKVEAAARMLEEQEPPTP